MLKFKLLLVILMAVSLGSPVLSEGSMTCDQWVKKLQTYRSGPNGLLPYPEAGKEQVEKWTKLYPEVQSQLKQFSKQFSDGSCSLGDMHKKYLDIKLADFKAMYPDAAKNAGKKTASYPSGTSGPSGSHKGEFIFSTQPIIPGHIAGLTNTFNAGQNIYGLVQVKKSWSKLYGKNNNFYVRVDVKVDGKKSVNGEKIHAQFITFKSKDYARRDYLIFNVAPASDKLVVYSDPNLEYGQTTAVIKQGPNELSYHLGRLSPGKHIVSFIMQNYGKVFAKGEFTINGGSYATYADLHKNIATGVAAARTLPSARLTNAKLENTMKKLLLNAGWKNVRRLNIVDKDWWTMSGGTGRYIDAAAVTENPKGKFSFKRCSFQQNKLLGGGFGKLFISKQGEAVPISAKNVSQLPKSKDLGLVKA